MIAWGDSYVPMTGHAIAIVCSGLALGELAVPQMFATMSSNPQVEASESARIGFAMTGAATIAGLLFLSAFMLAKKHGSR